MILKTSPGFNPAYRTTFAMLGSLMNLKMPSTKLRSTTMTWGRQALTHLSAWHTSIQNELLTAGGGDLELRGGPALTQRLFVDSSPILVVSWS